MTLPAVARLVFLSVAAALTTSACTSAPALPPGEANESLSVDVKDDPTNHRFIVRMTWKGPESYCLDDETWPTSTGQIVNGHGVVLTTEAGSLEPQEVNGGYCPGGCFSALAADAVREGFVNYSVFGDPEEIKKHTSRALTINPRVVRCKTSKENAAPSIE